MTTRCGGDRPPNDDYDNLFRGFPEIDDNSMTTFFGGCHSFDPCFYGTMTTYDNYDNLLLFFTTKKKREIESVETPQKVVMVVMVVISPLPALPKTLSNLPPYGGSTGGKGVALEAANTYAFFAPKPRKNPFASLAPKMPRQLFANNFRFPVGN